MARLPAPPPDIVGLTLLLRLYSILKDLPNPVGITEAEHIKNTAVALSRDGIIGASSINQASKLLGKPYNELYENAVGINSSILNKIAEKVLLAIDTNFKEAKSTGNYWSYFLKRIAKTPADLQELNTRKYYKYLTEGQKRAVSIYVTTRVDALGVDPNIQTFLVYLWSHEIKGIRSALLQINKRTQSCTFQYFTKIGEDWTPWITFIRDKENGEFLLTESLCYITLTDNTGSKSYKRVSFYLQTNEYDFYRLKYQKGFLMMSTQNGSVPTAIEVVLEKRNSFKEAFAVIESEKVLPQIHLELINRRYVSNPPNSNFSPGTLRSTHLFSIVQAITGAYLFAYIAKSVSPRQGAIVIGIAYIEESGNITMQVTHSPEFHAYIDNEFFERDIVRINPLSEYQAGLQYHLKMEYEYTTQGIPSVQLLRGKTLGHRDQTILGGNIVFQRVKKFESFRAIREKIEPKEIREKQNVKNLTMEEKNIIKLLITEEQREFGILNLNNFKSFI